MVKVGFGPPIDIGLTSDALMRVNALPIGHIPVLIDVRRGRLVSKTFDAWPAMDWRWIGQGPRDEWPIGADLAYM